MSNKKASVGETIGKSGAKLDKIHDPFAGSGKKPDNPYMDRRHKHTVNTAGMLDGRKPRSSGIGESKLNISETPKITDGQLDIIEIIQAKGFITEDEIDDSYQQEWDDLVNEFHICRGKSGYVLTATGRKIANECGRK